MSKTTAIIQARMGSTRLPGKVLADLAGRPLIGRLYDRLKLADSIEQIVYAIPEGEKDNELADYITRKGWDLYRGQEDDVLGRYVGAAKAFDADPIVRITADCPLIDPGVVNGVVKLFQSGDFDMTASNIEATFPHGLDVECFSRAALIAADEGTQDAYEREHVTLYMLRHSDVFRLGNLSCEQDLSEHRWTVDYVEDLAFVRMVFETFKHRLYFTTADVLRLMDLRPELMEINKGRANA